MDAKTDLEDLMKIAMPKKFELIDKAAGINSALEFGGVWRVDMVYLKYLLSKGSKKCVEIDNIVPKNIPDGISFINADFRSPEVLDNADNADLIILFDIILHQANVLSTFRNLLNKSNKYVVFSQPVFDPPGMPMRNSMFYMPGNDLDTFGFDNSRYSLAIKSLADFGPQGIDNPNKWHWAMSTDLIRTWFNFLGFRIIFENNTELKWLWEGWRQWGCVAEKNS